MFSSSPPPTPPLPVAKRVIQQPNDDEEVIPTFRFAVSLDGIGCYDYEYCEESFMEGAWEKPSLFPF